MTVRSRDLKREVLEFEVLEFGVLESEVLEFEVGEPRAPELNTQIMMSS